MNILSIDTSCDETACAVTQDTKVLSNVIWSQASAHAKFGGVMPSLAQRMHEERIDWVVERAMINAKYQMLNIDCVAVTVGPGLSIALKVGIEKAKEIAKKYNKPLIPINHVESHLLSAFANSKSETLNSKQISNFKFKFPSFGLVLSGGTTLFCSIKNIGEYQVLAETQDDALGEALDKAARLLGFGYPGAAILEKLAKNGDIKKYPLSIPLVEDKIKNRFSYSGLKSAFVRLFNSTQEPTKQNLSDLAASFQNVAFEHVVRVVSYQINHLSNQPINNLLIGGGVINNIELRKRLRKLCKENNMKLCVPYSKKLLGDNAAMIGVCAYLKYKDEDLSKFYDYDSVTQNPKLKL